MNIGYVNIKKVNKNKNFIHIFIDYMAIIFHSIFQPVWNLKYRKSEYFIVNTKKKTLRILKEKLTKDKIDFIVTEGNLKIDYRTINERNVAKYFIKDIIDSIRTKYKIYDTNVYICTNEYTDENVYIIRELVNKFNLVNIITENTKFKNLEKSLERENKYIVVSFNKRLALKKARFAINFDIKNLKKFNMNSNIVMINFIDGVELPENVYEKIQPSIILNSKKIMRTFCEHKNFEKSKLITCEMLKAGNYNNIRNKINSDKIFVESCQ